MNKRGGENLIKQKGKKGKLSLFVIFVLLFSLVASSLAMAETIDANSQMDALDTQAEETLLEESENELEVEPEEELGEKSKIDEDEGLKVVLEKQGETEEALASEPAEKPEEDGILDELVLEEEEMEVMMEMVTMSEIGVQDDVLPPEDGNYIVVEKKFEGITSEQIPENFMISVTNNATNNVYELKNQTYQSGSNIEHLDTGDDLIFRWRINNADVGFYTVSESGMSIANYDVLTEGTGSIEVVASELTLSGVERWNNNNTQDWPMAEGEFFAASLTQQGVIVITRYSLSASDRLAIENTLRYNLGFPAVWDRQYHFYSIEQQIETGDGFELNGAVFTYNFDTNMMHISDTSVWQQVASGDYDITVAQNPEISITNAYTPQTSSVTIRKLITGNFGDMNRIFEFDVTVDKGDPIDPFILGNDETKSLTARKDATLTLTEINSVDYEVIVTVGDTIIPRNEEDGSYTIVVADIGDGVEIVVTNNYDVIIDTGINLDSLPYVLILGLATMGLGVTIIRKRNVHSQD